MAAAASTLGAIFTVFTCGARFGTWYATSTSSTIGVSLPAALVKVRRYCRYRAVGDSIGMNSVAGCSFVQSLQPLSEFSPTLELRVATVSLVSAGNVP